MKVVEIRRYPVKSMLGEVLPVAEVGARGLAGDRLWAVRDPDGKFGSGKNTRRFRRMPGLFNLRAYEAEPAPIIELPDRRRFAADDPDGHHAVGEILGRPVTLAPEGPVPHHDEGTGQPHRHRLVTPSGQAECWRIRRRRTRPVAVPREPADRRSR